MDEGNGPDWAAIRLAVEAGGESQTAIARRFGVSQQSISHHKRREGWAMKVDIAGAAEMEASLNRLTRQILSELKRHAAGGRRNRAAAKALADAALDDTVLAKRIALQERAEVSLERILKMTTIFTRLMDRAVKAAAAQREIEERDDRSLEAFEAELLAKLGLVDRGGVLEKIDEEGLAPPEPDVVVRDGNGADAA